MTDPIVLWLNAHMDTCAPLQTWDTMHIQRALLQARDMCWLHEPYPPLEMREGVVLVSGQHHATPEDYAHINGALSTLERAVLIVHSDEQSLFDWRQIDHPALTWWISTPRRSVHGDMPDGTRFFGEGAGPPVSLPPVAKDLDVYFAGQATHRSRRELVGVLQAMDAERVVCEPTAGFMQGRPRAGYLSQMARAKVVPCPAGAACVDSFRLHEAIAAGCVPVVERFDPRGVDEGFWSLAYPEGVPFPIVDSWSELPGLLPGLLADFDRLAFGCGDWWRFVQERYVDWLRADLGV